MRLLRINEVIEKTTLPRSSIWHEIKYNNFPKPIKITTRTRVWDEAEINEWILKRIEARNNDSEN